MLLIRNISVYSCITKIIIGWGVTVSPGLYDDLQLKGYYCDFNIHCNRQFT